MNYIIFDIETDGLLQEVTKMHCLSYEEYDKDFNLIEKRTLVRPYDVINFFKKEGYYIGHNIITYDLPVLKKLFNIEAPKHLIDTLALSYNLFCEQEVHGLEYWGKRLGILKVEILNWKNLTQEQYKERCEVDVEINTLLFRFLFAYVLNLYDKNFDKAMSLVRYLNFKMDCLREQEKYPIKLNVEYCKQQLQAVTKEFEDKNKALSDMMPKGSGKLLKTKPVKMTKKDGTLSKKGEEWIQYLRDNKLPLNTEEIREAPNPGSSVQLKSWLFSLGWNPITFKESTSKKEPGKQIPQVSLPFQGGICPSVQELYEDHPDLEMLEGYFMLKHRIGVFQGFLDSMDTDGYIAASAGGFTNTMRLKHRKPLVNLPKPGVPWGKEIRSCLCIPDDNHIMIGSDISSLEDSTKQHYIYFYDPDYVREMRVPGFDPHIDIAYLAGFITKEDVEFFKKVDNMQRKDFEELSFEEKARYATIKKKRAKGKTTNFACTYGAGGPKIAKTAKVSVDEGYKLHKIYWQRNKAIKQLEADAQIKTISYNYPVNTKDGVKWVSKTQEWVYNPISHFWIYLKNRKDIFSAINQSSGVAVFDMWLRFVREELKNRGLEGVNLQYHDELFTVNLKKYEDTVISILYNSMKKVNQILNLNIEITISVDIGENYAEVH